MQRIHGTLYVLSMIEMLLGVVGVIALDASTSRLAAPIIGITVAGLLLSVCSFLVMSHDKAQDTRAR